MAFGKNVTDGPGTTWYLIEVIPIQNFRDYQKTYDTGNPPTLPTGNEVGNILFWEIILYGTIIGQPLIVTIRVILRN